MIVYVCDECMPKDLDSFDGPEDERECIACGCAKLCREVDVKDAIRTAALVVPRGTDTEPVPPSVPAPGPVRTSAAPAVAIPPLPALPLIPGPGTPQAGQ